MLAKWISSAESPRCSLRRTLGRRRPIRQPPEKSLCVNDREGGGGEGEVIGTYDKRPRGGKNPGHARATRCQAMSRRSDKADSSLSDGLSSAERTTCKFVERCGVFHEPDGGRRRHSRQRPCPVPVLNAARSAVGLHPSPPPPLRHHVRIPEIRISWDVHHRRGCLCGCRWQADRSHYTAPGRDIPPRVMRAPPAYLSISLTSDWRRRHLCRHRCSRVVRFLVPRPPRT